LDRRLLIERLAGLGFSPDQYFVTSTAAMDLHGIPRKENGKESVHIVVHPDLFNELENTHGLLPPKYGYHKCVEVAPGIFASTKYWDYFHKSVQLVRQTEDSNANHRVNSTIAVPVLRLGKLYHFVTRIERETHPEDQKAVGDRIASVINECKSKGKSLREIGDHLGVSEPSVPLLAKRLLKFTTTQFKAVGQLNPDYVQAEFDRVKNWDKVATALLPKQKHPRVIITRVLNASKNRETPQLISTHEVKSPLGKKIVLQQTGYDILDRKKPRK